MTPFNERMRKAREEAGLSIYDACVAARPLLTQAQEFKTSTLHRLETVTDEKDADPIRIWALARVYGLRVGDLSEVAADWLDKHFLPYTGPERRKRRGRRDQRKSPSRWTPIYAGELAAAC